MLEESATFIPVLTNPTTESTYAFTDCCVGISVAEFDTMLSSSTNAVAVIVPSDREPNVTVPSDVKFLIVAMSLLASTTSALEAATVPAVIPSIVSNSASLITAEPIVNPAAVTTPLKLGASSTDIVSWLPLSVDVVTLVPPCMKNESTLIANCMLVESSAPIVSVVPELISLSTYALIDCCVASAVSESDDMSSSSTMVDTTTPSLNPKFPLTCKASLIVTAVESAELIVFTVSVPSKLAPPTTDNVESNCNAD